MTFSSSIQVKHPQKERTISRTTKPIVVAEIGINHGGELALAKEMVLAAKEAGADYVKFQAFQPQDLVNFSQKDSELWQIFDRCALSSNDLGTLSQFCRENKIGFSATPFGRVWVDTLLEIGVPFIKIASGDIVNRFLLEYTVEQLKAKKLKIPIFMSCGAATIAETKKASSRLIELGHEDFVLLYCVSMYPTPAEKLHLSQIEALAEENQCLTGFSDHSGGSWAGPVAATLGARVFEKHFTTDSSLPFGDNGISTEPVDFKAMVDGIQNAFLATSAKVEQPNPEELAGNEWGRRGLYSKDGIPLAPKNNWQKLYQMWREDEIDFTRPRHDPTVDLFD